MYTTISYSFFVNCSNNKKNDSSIYGKRNYFHGDVIMSRYNTIFDDRTMKII